MESKTRAIDACPLDYTILCRMYWGPAISYFHLNPGFHTGVAIGIDPDRQWDELFKTMIRFGDVGLDLDFSAFDASLSPFMIREAGRIMSELSGTPSHFGEASPYRMQFWVFMLLEEIQFLWQSWLLKKCFRTLIRKLKVRE